MGGAVVSRLGTRVDGYSSPRAKKLVLQVSKVGMFMGCKGSGWVGYHVNVAIYDL
jgi:hypothetical protein